MYRSALLMLTVLLTLSFSQQANACKKKKKTPVTTTTTAAASDAKKKNILDGCRKYEGLFTIYQDSTSGKTYMLIKEDQLNKEYIYFSYIENGVLDASFHRGQYRGEQIFSLRKYFGRIEFVQQNTNYFFDTTNAVSKAADANISPSILASEPTLDDHKVKGEFLINADKIFLTENISQVKPNSDPRMPFGFKLGKLSTEKTKYLGIHSYPQNTDVMVEYVYENDNPAAASPAVTDARYVSVKMQHSIVEVPKNDFQPRADDPRVGFFSKQVNDMTSTGAVNYKDVIHRWNLVKKDPAAAVSEPVKPITWYIENTTPKAFRETIKKGVLAWNVAFEKAGFKNAIQVFEQPADATWDAGDIRYNVLRWTSSPNPPFGGYGPSFCNPRTGEIIGADIMLEYVLITNRLREDRIFNSAGMDLIEEEQAAEQHRNDASPYCSFGTHMVNNNILGIAAMKMIDATDAEQSEYIKAALMDVVMHEVGHTLGLMHNMKSSNMISPDDIDNKELTQKIGLIGSVMDYNLPNIALDHSKQGEYYPSRVGPYDEWAIEYAYSPSVADAKAEKERLSKILSRSAEPRLMFGNDADDMRAAGRGIDPRVMVGDLTSDAITYSIKRIELCKKILPTIKQRFAINGQSYQELRSTYLVLTGAQATALGVISRYIGGVYVNRAFIGQPDSIGKPYVPVDYKDQKRAMAALSKYLFSKDAFKGEEELYSYLQQQRRGFNFFNANEDPRITERALTVYRSIFAQLLHVNVLDRLTDSELYGNKYTLSEMMDDLTKAVFAEDMKGNVNIFRQFSQAEYVGLLIRIANNYSGEFDHPSMSNALYQLKQIQKDEKASASIGDLGTKAHREQLLYQIEKALSPKG